MSSTRATPPGATIYSVAERAGVSIATVSRVIQRPEVVSGATRQRVLDAIDELHYVPLGAARSLAVRHHEAHGLVLPELAGPYFAELLVGFEERAAELGQSVVLLLADTKRDVDRAVRQLSTRVDGLAVFASTVSAETVSRVRQGRKPVVTVAGGVAAAGLGTESISAENASSARELTEHVLAHGRRRVLFVGDPDLSSDTAARHDGFVAAHRARRRRPAPPVRIAFRENDGTEFAERLLAGEFTADALVCANDELALSVMTHLQDAGRDVPGDVAVVGWDDVMTARYVRPGLTTVRQPVADLGRLAAERLHHLVDGDDPADEPWVLPTRLVLRGSCGCG
ncbi:LacI family DNA-binding transcriptional regulator [Terracoccus luteus]|uniref:LacI family transcriptional regulator n=1 Tax=Terracoccus luteus TaxID=53356 RepID=A0A839PXB4_9MICO|nr:LacI family DNA-binding transcriptional regulator [Terracoccus luteus]MBB2986626.1 LacI family transcriptional regulator [Terracoccus luteus]MCP2171785.1 LacI family transcriptional regulator [Terracoccus luteus]